MQVKVKKTARHRAGPYLQAALVAVLAGTVWYTLDQQRTGLRAIFSELRTTLAGAGTQYLGLVVGLTALNWSLEARKWQVLARRIERVPFGRALRGVLAGASIGFVSQVNAGDFVGKIGTLHSDRRLDALGAVLLGSLVQTFVTLAFGTAAYALFLGRVPQPLTAGPAAVLLGLLAILGLLLGLYARRAQLEPLLARWSWLRRFGRHVHVMQTYPLREVLGVIGWAVLRHLTFTVQFLLVLRLFGVMLPLRDAWTVVNLVFLAKTVVPTVHFLSDLGVREFSALYFFGFFGVPAARVASATLALWVVNLLVPVVVGSGFALQLTYFRSTR
jgi:uncharacterized membrane protein YbhN (UPF0104 family)